MNIAYQPMDDMFCVICRGVQERVSVPTWLLQLLFIL